MTMPSSTVLKIVRSARLDKVGKPRKNSQLDDSWILTDAYIIFKEMGLALDKALRKYSLTVSERQELAQELLAACTRLEQLMDKYELSSRHTGDWFLNRTRNWAEQLAAPEFEQLRLN